MSTLSVACPYCQAKIKVPEKMIGRQINCPSCKQGLKLEGAPPAGGGADPFAFSGGGGQVPAQAADFGAMTDAGTSRPRGRPSAFWEFLTFRRMIAPIVLQILFWILIVLTIGSGGFTVIGGVIAMTATTTTVKDDRFGGKGDPFGRDPFDMPSAGRSAGLFAGGLLIVTGLFQMIFGPLVIRVSFELMMMIFRVYDVLREIRDKLDRR